MEQRRAASWTSLAASADRAATGWGSCSSAASLAFFNSATNLGIHPLVVLHQQPWVPLLADSAHLLVEAAVPAEQLLPGHRQPLLSCHVVHQIAGDADMRRWGCCSAVACNAAATGLWLLWGRQACGCSWAGGAWKAGRGLSEVCEPSCSLGSNVPGARRGLRTAPGQLL